MRRSCVSSGALPATRYTALAAAHALFLAADMAFAVLDAVGLPRLAFRDAFLRAQGQRELARAHRGRPRLERGERHAQSQHQASGYPAASDETRAARQRFLAGVWAAPGAAVGVWCCAFQSE